MSRVDGETLARKILRDDEYAGARRISSATSATSSRACTRSIRPRCRVRRCRLGHAVLGRLRATRRREPDVREELRWFSPTDPRARATTIVHGDLRLGNVIVDDHGLAAAIDWELVHVGDPLEDLAWLCVKAWRFGAPLRSVDSERSTSSSPRTKRRVAVPSTATRCTGGSSRRPCGGAWAAWGRLPRTSAARCGPTSSRRSAGASPNRSGT